MATTANDHTNPDKYEYFTSLTGARIGSMKYYQEALDAGYFGVLDTGESFRAKVTA